MPSLTKEAAQAILDKHKYDRNNPLHGTAGMAPEKRAEIKAACQALKEHEQAEQRATRVR